MRTSTLVLLAAVAAGCKSDGKPGANADVNSGPDANRSGATLILVNHDYTDRVDIRAGDQTDWKSVELKGKSDAMTVDLRWDNTQADVAVDAFDPAGAQIASSPANGGTPTKKLLIPIEREGVYYLRFTARTPKQGSDYTFIARWEVAASEPPPPVVEDPAPKPRPKQHVERSEPRPPRKKGGGSPESGLQGRVVSARREGEGMVLFIDKGRTAGVSEGQNGWVLEGNSGASPLEGGTFTITSVVDEARSIGKTGLKSIGRNNRVSINTGK